MITERTGAKYIPCPVSGDYTFAGHSNITNVTRTVDAKINPKHVFLHVLRYF